MVKTGTVWLHLANLIEHNQLSVWKVLQPERVSHIIHNIISENDTLKAIKTRIKNDSVSYEEINCVLSYVKSKNRPKNVSYHINWYKKVHCLRKCYLDKTQRKECARKFNIFISKNPELDMTNQEFLELFNTHLTICAIPEKEKRGHITWKQFKLMQSYFKRKEKKK